MKHLLVLSFLLLASAATLAGTAIDQTRSVSADASIKIVNTKGAVHVTAWERNQVHVTGTLGKGTEGLQIEKHGNTLRIKVKIPEHTGWFHWNSDNRAEPTTLNVQVPRGASIAIDTVSATADIHGLSGGIIDIGSVSGDIRVAADSPKVNVNAVSARVELSGQVEQTDIQTVSGDVIALNVGKHGSLETVSGEIHLTGGPYAKVSMDTVSGDIDLTGGLQNDGHIKIASVSGDVMLHLPAMVAAHMRISTFSGSIDSAFGKTVKKGNGPGASIDSQIGSGDGRIDIQTFSGDVRVQKNH